MRSELGAGDPCRQAQGEHLFIHAAKRTAPSPHVYGFTNGGGALGWGGNIRPLRRMPRAVRPARPLPR